MNNNDTDDQSIKKSNRLSSATTMTQQMNQRRICSMNGEKMNESISHYGYNNYDNHISSKNGSSGKKHGKIVGRMPHHGSLCRVVDNECDFLEPLYMIEIDIEVDVGMRRGGFSEHRQLNPLSELSELGRFNSEADDSQLPSSKTTAQHRRHELAFNRHDYEFASRVFAILDSESVGYVDQETVHEFVYRRCPVFWKRDEDLFQMEINYSSTNFDDNRLSSDKKSSSRIQNHSVITLSPTFVEIWQSVCSCSVRRSANTGPAGDGKVHFESEKRDKIQEETRFIGLEGWMVFFRFIALAQYLEAKRRFSARHLQQTMRHRNSPRGSEMVVINVPPAEPPVPLTPFHLVEYEQRNMAPLPAPELDLDHVLLAARDSYNNRTNCNNNWTQSTTKKDFPNGRVRISLFGSASNSSGIGSSSLGNNSGIGNNLEFTLAYSYFRNCTALSMSSLGSAGMHSEVVVRRSIADMKWLEETFTSHKVLGGTLCGRIMPPFPGSSSSSTTITNKVLSSHFQGRSDDQTASILSSSLSIQKTTETAINAAAVSVGRIRDVAKFFVGSYIPTSVSLTTRVTSLLIGDGSSSTQTKLVATTTTATPQHGAVKPQQKSSHSRHKEFHSKKRSINISLRDNYYSPNSPLGMARQLERYLNYLLEHPALSTSFPLNTILKASQSGVEAAKQCLDECTRVSKEIRDRTPQLLDGKVGIPFWPQQTSNFSLNSPNFAWVRTAAQAAIALKVHGMLETSGLPSASARLQHASLPFFGHIPSRSNSGWEDIENDSSSRTAPVTNTFDKNSASNNFEEGVVNDDGFDLLPLPVLAPERRILNVGSITDVHLHSTQRPQEERFHYGNSTIKSQYSYDSADASGSAFLGDVAVDENIDKLREVIGSVDSTLSRCVTSIGGIGKAHTELQNLHLNIVGGLDSWTGMRGKFVSQRSLLKGVAGLKQSRSIAEEGDLALIDDLSWQSSLASSAVSAAEDVRGAVRASRTASNARVTANAAALSAQQACEKGDFTSMEDARAAQTRASIAQSHAIHAAVVEHEAKTVKRRATLALAHDVKTWNIHRKREMLLSCIAYAKSQHEASRRAVDSWLSLEDGFIGTSVVPTTVDRRQVTLTIPVHENVSNLPRRIPQIEPDEVTTTFFDGSGDVGGPSFITAVNHVTLTAAATESKETSIDQPRSLKNISPETFLPFAEPALVSEDPSPVSEEEETNLFEFLQDKKGCMKVNHYDNVSSDQVVENNVEVDSDSKNVTDSQLMAYTTLFDISSSDHDSSEEKVSSTVMSNIDGEKVNADEDVVGDLIGFRRSGFNKHDTNLNSNNIFSDENLSESMQSLVDGLMSWGGGFETEEEHIALPAGMATSIVAQRERRIVNRDMSLTI